MPGSTSETDVNYEVLNGERVKPWRFGDLGENRYLDVATMLRGAMSRNRSLKVMLASGYYDLATPFAAAEWSLDHMSLDASLRGNITMTRYEAGHMMYVHGPSLKKLRRDMAAFLESAAPKGQSSS